MNDMITDDPMEFFSILSIIGNSYWGMPFQWVVNSDGDRVPYYTFCNV